FPVTALQGGRVRLAPEGLGRGEITSCHGLFDLEEPGLPCELGLGPDGVIGERVPDGRRQQHGTERRGDRWDEQAEPAARPELLHHVLHAHQIRQGRYHPEISEKTPGYRSRRRSVSAALVKS